MLIKAGYEIRFTTKQPTPMIALLSVHPSRQGDLKTKPHLATDPSIETLDYRDGFGNVVTRFLLPEGETILSNDFVIEDSGAQDRIVPDAEQHPVEELPDEVLVYLLGSRYCETDRLSDTAWGLFGHIPPGWQRLQAILDFTHRHIEFGYQHARPTKTAWDAHQEQRGVCRDYAHLAITLCRCMNIPARYCTGFLGDIGVPPSDSPMDFSAWFDVFLGGEWITADARHNKPRIGRILMARGRDATDCALTTAFGSAILTGFTVHTDVVESVG
ncbi:MAG: transglutaminase family protein [Sphingomicrobium sp.]